MSQNNNSVSAAKPVKKTPNDYIFGKLIGEGSFSNVYLAKDANGHREYAIKVCDKAFILREKKAELIQREKQVMTILSSNRSEIAPYFVNLYATFQDSERLYFVMTYASGGELLKLLNTHNTFDMETCRFYAGEIIQALCHLHNLKIVHRDLKPENILLNEFGHILITDFGSAKILLSSSPSAAVAGQPADTENQNTSGTENDSSKKYRRNSFVGTAQYVSPEVLHGKYSIVGPPADLWAFGCVVFQFLTGSSPFNGPNEYLIFQKVVKVNYQFPEAFDPQAQDIIHKLLRLEPNERLGANDEMRYTSIKSHDFFQGIDFDGLHKNTPPTFTPLTEEMQRLNTKDKKETPQEEPGFNPQVIAQRLLSGDGDSPIIWANSTGIANSPTSVPSEISKKDVDVTKDKEQFELIRTSSKGGDTILQETVISEKCDQPEKNLTTGSNNNNSSINRCYCC